MYELHGSVAHHGHESTTQRFADCWNNECLVRETVSGDVGTLYIDQYKSGAQPDEQYTTYEELLIAVDGSLHDVSPTVRKQIDQPVSTATPTAILAAAYRTLGYTFPQALVGDYRFLIIDRAEQRLVAGRDRTITEAVYVAITDEATLVSTDLVALAHEVNAGANAAYLGEYLTGTIESAYETFYTGVYRIPPGCVCISTEGTPRIERYYQPYSASHTAEQRSKDDLGAQLRDILEEAVACRTTPTEATGIFMSGGADSTAIACLLAQDEPQPPVTTYSYRFPNTDGIDEMTGITAVIDEYGLPNETISLDDYWILKDTALYERAWTHAPAVDPLLQPKHALLQRAAADGVATMLIGDNGNVLDGSRLSIADALGARQYNAAITTARADPAYTTVACLVLYGLLPHLGLHVSHEMPSTMIPEHVRRLLTPTVRDKVVERRQSPRRSDSVRSYRNQAIYRSMTAPAIDYRTDILHKLAKSHGLRLVDPYQDSRLIDFLYNMPYTYNLEDGYDKVMFRRALSDILPDVILSRLKADRIEEEEAEGLRREAAYITSLLDHDHLQSTGVVRPAYSFPATDTLIEDFESGQLAIWRLLSAQAWLDTHPAIRDRENKPQTDIQQPFERPPSVSRS